MKNIYFLGVIFFFITSCSIQKRQHLNGYYFSWNKIKKQNEISKQENTDTIVYHTNERIDLIASTENNYDFIKKQPYNEK
ncbi:MAG: hypothetical protein IPH32_18725 [Bacteroidetes bacterium]|nr:hypothetical protein [Bacteroidota bacterium]